MPQTLLAKPNRNDPFGSSSNKEENHISDGYQRVTRDKIFSFLFSFFGRGFCYVRTMLKDIKLKTPVPSF